MFVSNMVEFVQKESVRIIDITQVTKMVRIVIMGTILLMVTEISICDLKILTYL